jgi:hypothetical protein
VPSSDPNMGLLIRLATTTITVCKYR